MSAMTPNITQLHLYFTEGNIWLKITSVFAGALRNKTKQKNLQTVYFRESLVILTPNKTKPAGGTQLPSFGRCKAGKFSYLEWTNLWR